MNDCFFTRFLLRFKHPLYWERAVIRAMTHQNDGGRGAALLKEV
jgi:hypothetical protein